MNPLEWKREHKVALLIAALVGICAALAVGFVAHGTTRGAAGGFSFDYWIGQPFRFGGFWWGLLGAACGAGMVYVRQLLRT